MIQLALYQPDIPQNTGSALRLCGCLGIPLHVIEPCGFIFDDRKLKRVSMDYSEKVTLVRHVSWERFLETMAPRRILLLTSKGSQPYTEFQYHTDDILLLGRESAGVPDSVHHRADARLRVPMCRGARSLNIMLAGSMVIGEALRQTNSFSGD